MRVLDAGVVVELPVGDLDPARLGSEDLAAPHLIDSEVTHVLRGLTTRGAVTLSATARLTTDARLAAAPGARCAIEVL